jgi:hypothetical protein
MIMNLRRREASGIHKKFQLKVLKVKITIREKAISMDRLNSRLNIEEGKINKFEDTVIETNPSETQR